MSLRDSNVANTKKRKRVAIVIANPAVSTGVAILRYARLSNGLPLAKGKTVTGFANVEEDFADDAVYELDMLSRDNGAR